MPGAPRSPPRTPPCPPPRTRAAAAHGRCGCQNPPRGQRSLSRRSTARPLPHAAASSPAASAHHAVPTIPSGPSGRGARALADAQRRLGLITVGTGDRPTALPPELTVPVLLRPVIGQAEIV